jgi:hypothetical protein
MNRINLKPLKIILDHPISTLSRGELMERRLMMIVFLVAVLAYFTGCGGKETSAPLPCAHVDVLGSWNEPINGDTLVVNADCTATSSLCAGDYEYVLRNDIGAFDFELLVHATNGGPNCPVLGSNLCTVSDGGAGQIVIDCGVGMQRYYPL